jgi:phosphodiesterase/alkaline phosphatase D-like protein
MTKLRRLRSGVIQAGSTVVTPPPPPATEFFEPFETDFSAWQAAVISGTGTLTLATAAASTGTMGAKIFKPENDSACYRRYIFPSTNSIEVEAEYRWISDSGNSVSRNGTGPRVFSGSSRIFDVFRGDVNGQLWLRYASTGLDHAGSLYINTGQTIGLGTFVKIRVRCDYTSGANSRMRVWINDVPRIDQSNLTVLSGNFTAFQIGSEHSAQYLDLHIDNAYVNWAPTPDEETEPPPDTPNLVYASGTTLRNTADGTLFDGSGLCVHTQGFAFSQNTFTNWYTEGIRFIRLMFWPRGIETAAGVYNQTELNYIHTSVQRAGVAGIRVLLCPLINTPSWGSGGSEAKLRIPDHWLNNTSSPTGPLVPVGEWNTASMFDCLCSHGEGYLKKIMTEFRSYNHVVMVEQCNEPDRLSAGPIQRGAARMLAWQRAEDAGTGKLFAVATNRYSSQDPNHSDNDWGAFTDLTNVVGQMHTYYAPQSNSNNGWDVTTGVRASGSGGYWNGSPEATTYSTANKASLTLHFEKWQTKMDALGIPWIIGEAGVQWAKATSGVRLAWTTDVVDTAETAGASAICAWIGADNFVQDVWSSSDSSVMRTEYLQFGSFTPIEKSGGGGAGGADVALQHMLSGAVTNTTADIVAVVDTLNASMRAVVSTSINLTSPIYSITQSASRGSATTGYTGSLHLAVTGLVANTEYFYGIEINGILKPNRAKFKTNPTPGTATSFSFGAASCQRTNNNTNNTVWDTIRLMSNPALAFFLHMGDLHYSDSPTWTTLTEARTAHNVALRQSGLAAYLAEKQFIYIYDDHDTGGNDTVKSSPWVGVAQDAYAHWFPGYGGYPWNGTGESPAYFKFQYGRVLYLFTDCRTARSNLADTDNSSKTVLGTAQKTWLKAQLSAAAYDTTVKLIVWISTTPWIGTVANNYDGWGSYITERTELANYITGLNLQNRMMILSGDQHASAIDNGTNSPGGIRVFQSGPLNQVNSSKGGPYTWGPHLDIENQFGIVTVTDPGGASEITVDLSARNGLTGAQISGGTYSFTTSGTPPALGNFVINGFENPVGNAVAITTGNSGGGDDDAFDSVSTTAAQTLATDNTVWYHGAQSGKFATGATVGASFVSWTDHAGATTIYGRAYIYMPVSPSAYAVFFRPYNASTSRLQLGVTSSGPTRAIRLLNSAGTTVATTTATLPLTTWVRVEWSFNFSTGAYTVKYFATANSTTPTETLSGTGASFGGTATEYRFGLCGLVANQNAINLDNIGIDIDGFLGPVAL